MRLVPRSWDNEMWVCSLRGHRTPARHVATLRPEDRELGVDLPDGRRLARCLRCDGWLDGWPPAEGRATSEVLPPLHELDLPRRDEPLADAILMRLIAINRAGHSIVFGILAVGLLLVETNLANLQSWANGWLKGAADVAGRATGGANHDWLARQLERVSHLDRHAIAVLALTSTAYCILEGVEGVFLWKERRWAEYLTVLATGGLLPFEVYELVERVTVFRIGALLINLAIIGYLVWSKRLFGVRGGPASLHESVDWAAILSPPVRVG